VFAHVVPGARKTAIAAAAKKKPPWIRLWLHWVALVADDTAIMTATNWVRRGVASVTVCSVAHTAAAPAYVVEVDNAQHRKIAGRSDHRASGNGRRENEGTEQHH